MVNNSIYKSIHLDDVNMQGALKKSLNLTDFIGWETFKQYFNLDKNPVFIVDIISPGLPQASMTLNGVIVFRKGSSKYVVSNISGSYAPSTTDPSIILCKLRTDGTTFLELHFNTSNSLIFNIHITFLGYLNNGQ